MRLGQLARKLDTTPAEIIQFLASKNINIENEVNTKLDDESVSLALGRFAPAASAASALARTCALVAVGEPEPDDTRALVLPAEIESQPSTSQTAAQSASEVETSSSAAPLDDVIKAPKVELAGLKVIGKIELPEKKKKETDEVEKATEQTLKPRPKHDSRRSDRPRRNPIALQRQKEAAEEERKKEEERRLQKERRTKNYLNKVKAAPPTKAAKIVKEQTETMTAEELTEAPKGWFRKFLKWLTT